MPDGRGGSGVKRNRPRARGKPPDGEQGEPRVNATVDVQSTEDPCAQRLDAMMERFFADMRHLLEEFAKLEAVVKPESSTAACAAGSTTEADSRLIRLQFFTSHVKRTMERMRAARTGRDPLSMPQLALLEEHIVTSIMPVRARLLRQLRSPDGPLSLSPKSSLADGAFSSESLSPCTSSAQSSLGGASSTSASLIAGAGSTSPSSSFSSEMGAEGENEKDWRIDLDGGDTEDDGCHSALGDEGREGFDFGLERDDIGISIDIDPSSSGARGGVGGRLEADGGGGGVLASPSRSWLRQRGDHCDLLGQLEVEGVFAADDSYSRYDSHISISGDLLPFEPSHTQLPGGGCKVELDDCLALSTHVASFGGGTGGHSPAQATPPLAVVKEEPSEPESWKVVPRCTILRPSSVFEWQASKSVFNKTGPSGATGGAADCAKIENQPPASRRLPHATTDSEVVSCDRDNAKGHASSANAAAASAGRCSSCGGSLPIARPEDPGAIIAGSPKSSSQGDKCEEAIGSSGDMRKVTTGGTYPLAGRAEKSNPPSPTVQTGPAVKETAHRSASVTGSGTEGAEKPSEDLIAAEAVVRKAGGRTGTAGSPPGSTRMGVGAMTSSDTEGAGRDLNGTEALNSSTAGSTGMMVIPMKPTKRRRISSIPAALLESREVHYQCGACSENYSAVVAGNPWWLLVRHVCPECHKMQIPRVDILNPTNNVEGHMSFLTEACAENGSDGDGSCNNWDGETSDDNSDREHSGDEGETSVAAVSSLMGDPQGGASGGAIGRLAGPALDSEQAAKLLVLMCHARGCPGHHRSPRLAEVCRSVKFLMLHLRDCDGRTPAGQPCPMPWCRPCTSLLHHLIQCPDSAQCQVCNPLHLPTPLRALRALNLTTVGNLQQTQQPQHVATAVPATSASGASPS